MHLVLTHNLAGIANSCQTRWALEWFEYSRWPPKIKITLNAIGRHTDTKMLLRLSFQMSFTIQIIKECLLHKDLQDQFQCLQASLLWREVRPLLRHHLPHDSTLYNTIIHSPYVGKINLFFISLYICSFLRRCGWNDFHRVKRGLLSSLTCVQVVIAKTYKLRSNTYSSMDTKITAAVCIKIYSVTPLIRLPMIRTFSTSHRSMSNKA